MTCEHLGFNAHAEIKRHLNGSTVTRTVTLSVKCIECGELMAFPVPQAFYLEKKPEITIPLFPPLDETEKTIPERKTGTTPDPSTWNLLPKMPAQPTGKPTTTQTTTPAPTTPDPSLTDD